jgi:hypothetical protein
MRSSFTTNSKGGDVLLFWSCVKIQRSGKRTIVTKRCAADGELMDRSKDTGFIRQESWETTKLWAHTSKLG